MKANKNSMCKMSTSTDKSKLILASKELEDPSDTMKYVKTLIAKGCSIKDIMKTAIDENKIDFVDSVINIKTDPSIISYKDEIQNTYLHKAINGSYVTSKYDIIHLMIKSGFDVNARTFYGFTPLMCASVADLSSIVRLLVENGANIDEKQLNFDGNTALMFAIFCWNKQIPNLIEQGASINIRNNHGNSSIEHALYRKEIDVMKIILYLT